MEQPLDCTLCSTRRKKWGWTRFEAEDDHAANGHHDHECALCGQLFTCTKARPHRGRAILCFGCLSEARQAEDVRRGPKIGSLSLTEDERAQLFAAGCLALPKLQAAHYSTAALHAALVKLLLIQAPTRSMEDVEATIAESLAGPVTDSGNHSPPKPPKAAAGN